MHWRVAIIKSTAGLVVVTPTDPKVVGSNPVCYLWILLFETFIDIPEIIVRKPACRTKGVFEAHFKPYTTLVRKKSHVNEPLKASLKGHQKIKLIKKIAHP